MRPTRAVKCEPGFPCGNPTTNPSGRCYRHEGTPVPSAVARGVSATPPSAPDAGTVRLHAPGLVEVPETLETVLGAVRSIGGTPEIVGGGVRDGLLGNPTPHDLDVEVRGVRGATELARALSRVGRVDEVGVAFGITVVTIGGDSYEVALPRRDSRTGVGHRGFAVEVDPDLSGRDAAARRDFTVNAMSWDPATEYVTDHFGGLADLEAGVLRHVGPTFGDDPLRVLRGVRFASTLGFRLAPETVVECRRNPDAHAELPASRLWGEWSRVGSEGSHLSAALETLRDVGWSTAYPDLHAVLEVEQDEEHHPEGPVGVHLGLSGDEAARAADAAGLTGEDRSVVVLGALLHDLGKATHTQVEVVDGRRRVRSHGHDEAGVEPVARTLRRMGAPERVVSRVTPIVAEHMCGSSTNGAAPTPTAVRRLVRRLGPATIGEWSLVCGADQAGRGSGARENSTLPFLEVARGLSIESRPAPALVSGRDLIAAGYRPGPGFGVVLAAATEAQDEGAFEDSAGGRAWLAAALADGRFLGDLAAR